MKSNPRIVASDRHAPRGARAYALALLVLALVAGFVGCASIPDKQVLRGRAETQTQAPVVSARGELSNAQSEAVIDKLRAGGERDLLDLHLEFVQRIGDAPLVLGNSAKLLIDGPAAHAAMFKAIASARDHVNMQTYIFEADSVGETLADLLLRKRAEGVEVNVIYDSMGSRTAPAAFFERLRAGGVAVCEFNPINPLKGRKFALNHRTHRKLLVVDGHVAYAGGINISSVYASSSSAKRSKPVAEDGWRDTQIEIGGPATAEFQKLFMQTWTDQECAPLAARAYYPPLKPQGDRIIRVIGSSPADEINLIYVEMLSAIMHARRSIHITMAYFVPDPQLLESLTAASRRGVEVVLILPGFSDFWVVFHAGRSHYQTLLDAGVRIYERKDALLHAKTAVIDGVWSTVGSANMDWRSFLHNDELNAVVLGAGFGREMARMFQTDLDAAAPIEAAAWSQRGLGTRMREIAARVWEYWL